MNCYALKGQILKSDIMEVLHQPPFPGFYKTKDVVDLDTLWQSCHVQYGKDPISIERFLEFLADISKSRVKQGEGSGRGGYGYD